MKVTVDAYEHVLVKAKYRARDEYHSCACFKNGLL